MTLLFTQWVAIRINPPTTNIGDPSKREVICEILEMWTLAKKGSISQACHQWSRCEGRSYKNQSCYGTWTPKKSNGDM